MNNIFNSTPPMIANGFLYIIAKDTLDSHFEEVVININDIVVIKKYSEKNSLICVDFCTGIKDYIANIDFNSLVGLLI